MAYNDIILALRLCGTYRTKSHNGRYLKHLQSQTRFYYVKMLRRVKWVTLYLSTYTRFRFLYFRFNNYYVYTMLHQVKELPTGRLLSYNNFTDKKKNKMAAPKKQCFFAFFVLNRVFTYRHSKSGV